MTLSSELVSDNARSETCAALAEKYPWPEDRPAVAPIDFTYDGGGRELVIEMIRRRRAKIVLEIGAFLGGSTRLWLDASPDVVVLAIDCWEGCWGNCAREAGRPECANQLDQPDGGYETFLANLWADRHRVVPVRGRSPEVLEAIFSVGVQPDLVYLDGDKSGVELEVCRELFPDAILTGDDWTFYEDGHYPIREPVETFCRRHGFYLRTKMATWVIDRQRPKFSYRVRRWWRAFRSRRANDGRMRASISSGRK